MDRIADWVGERGCEALNAVGLLDAWGCGAFRHQLGWGVVITFGVVAMLLIIRSAAKAGFEARYTTT